MGTPSLWQLHDFVHLGRLPEDVVVAVDGGHVLRVVSEDKFRISNFPANSTVSLPGKWVQDILDIVTPFGFGQVSL